MKSKSSILKGVSGRVGNFVLKQHRGQTVAVFQPNINPQKRKAESRFAQAARYARTAIQDPDKRLMYSRRISKKNNSVHAVAFTDFLIGPDILEVDARGYDGNAGDEILIHAEDNIEVRSVRVTIWGFDQNILETGDAYHDSNRPTVYIFSSNGHSSHLSASCITIEVSDHAGNLTTLDVSMT